MRLKTKFLFMFTFACAILLLLTPISSNADDYDHNDDYHIYDDCDDCDDIDNNDVYDNDQNKDLQSINNLERSQDEQKIDLQQVEHFQDLEKLKVLQDHQELENLKFFQQFGGLDNAEDLWQIIRQEFAMADIAGLEVDKQSAWYRAKSEYVQNILLRSKPYLFYIFSEVKRRNLPMELALLPFIESGFNPHAKSSAQAAGMWQFIPGTGKDFLLKQNFLLDERHDILASTSAALDYLKQLYDQFQDWALALAAYNWGQGSVSRAIATNERMGLPTDYLNLKMPNETRAYVPKLQALKNLILAPESFNIKLPSLANRPYFASIVTERDIDISLAAQLSGLTVKEFKALNPAFKHKTIIGASNSKILLPLESAADFLKKLNNYPDQLSSWTAIRIFSRQTIEKIAKHLGVAVEIIRSVNKIPYGMLLAKGSTIVIPKTKANMMDISATLLENASFILEPVINRKSKVMHKSKVYYRKSRPRLQ